MKTVAMGVFVFIFASCIGRGGHVILADVTAEKGPTREVVVHFSTDIDILAASEWKFARLRVPAQQVARPDPTVADCPDGSAWVATSDIAPLDRTQGNSGERCVYRVCVSFERQSCLSVLDSGNRVHLRSDATRRY
jgi:hypothetical protein